MSPDASAIRAVSTANVVVMVPPVPTARPLWSSSVPDGTWNRDPAAEVVHKDYARAGDRHAIPAALRSRRMLEIGGAWLVWQGLREHRGWIWVGLGVISLGLYGAVATFQPDAHFG